VNLAWLPILLAEVHVLALGIRSLTLIIVTTSGPEYG
jgi:hypothetical protein